MKRVPDLDIDALTPEQHRVWERSARGKRDMPLGPTRAWLASPEFASRAHELAVYLRYGSALPPRLSELAILTMAVHWRSKFEWFAHYSDGLKSGLDPAPLDVLRTGGTPSFAREDEAAVHSFAHELLNNKRVSDDTFRRAHAALGQMGVVDLVAILGYYGIVSMTLNSFEIGLPPGVEDPFPES